MEQQKHQHQKISFAEYSIVSIEFHDVCQCSDHMQFLLNFGLTKASVKQHFHLLQCITCILHTQRTHTHTAINAHTRLADMQHNYQSKITPFILVWLGSSGLSLC